MTSYSLTILQTELHEINRTIEKWEEIFKNGGCSFDILQKITLNNKSMIDDLTEAIKRLQ